MDLRADAGKIVCQDIREVVYARPVSRPEKRQIVGDSKLRPLHYCRWGDSQTLDLRGPRDFKRDSSTHHDVR